MSVEHKRPLYAFAVLAIVCGIFLGHALRSDALVGVFQTVVAAAPAAPASRLIEEPALALSAPPAGEAARRAPEATHPPARTADQHGRSGGGTGRSDDRRGPSTDAPPPTDPPGDTTGDADPPVTVPSEEPVPTQPPVVTIPDPVDPAATRADKPVKAPKAPKAPKDWVANRPTTTAEDVGAVTDKAAQKAVEKAAKDMARNAADAAKAAEDAEIAAQETAEKAAQKAAEKTAEKAAQDDDLRTAGPPDVAEPKDAWLP
ncbi:hypothetical protein [Nocardioides sp. LHG3406-4]|uniref:hypothetical protein n=1 Tax=Nocardioides sp. LHG3406-4 TaxID=2804575 RepID=UPI003CF05F64